MTMATAAAVCSLENYLVLPDNTMDERIAAARKELGRECVILGHHYQRDEVIRFADFRGDSYRLAQLVAAGLTNDAGDGITPITYMNSTAAIKAICGEREGVVCTSSNAPGAF